MQIQILLSLTFLIIASAYDLKTMEVPNKLWVIFMPLSIIMTAANVSVNPNQVILTLTSIGVTTLIAVAIFYLGLYGGADAKALITLSIADPIQLNQIRALPIFPLTTLNNSLILMVLTLPIALIRNLFWKIRGGHPLFQGLESEPIWKKAAALLLCIKTSKSKMKPYHMLAERIQITDGEVKKKLKIFQRVKEDDTIIDDTVPEDVFILYSLPMLPFITLGYLLSITIGDLILHLTLFFLV